MSPPNSSQHSHRLYRLLHGRQTAPSHRSPRRSPAHCASHGARHPRRRNNSSRRLRAPPMRAATAPTQAAAARCRKGAASSHAATDEGQVRTRDVLRGRHALERRGRRGRACCCCCCRALYAHTLLGRLEGGAAEHCAHMLPCFERRVELAPPNVGGARDPLHLARCARCHTHLEVHPILCSPVTLRAKVVGARDAVDVIQHGQEIIEVVHAR